MLSRLKIHIILEFILFENSYYFSLDVVRSAGNLCSDVNLISKAQLMITNHVIMVGISRRLCMSLSTFCHCYYRVGHNHA